MAEAITLMLQEQQVGAHKGGLKEELKEELRLQHKQERLIKDKEQQQDNFRPVNLPPCLPDQHLALIVFRMILSNHTLMKLGQN